MQFQFNFIRIMQCNKRNIENHTIDYY